MPLAVLCVSLILTAIVAMYVSGLATARDNLRFDSAVERTQNAIQRRIETYISMLRGCAGLFASEAPINRFQFGIYVNQLDLSAHYPGIEGVGICTRLEPRLDAKVMQVVRQRMAREGVKDFAITPPGERNAYYPIFYFEPARSSERIGYDLATDRLFWTAMQQARDSGSPAGTARMAVAAPGSHATGNGFVIFVPVYYFIPVRSTTQPRQILSTHLPTTPGERQTYLAGFAFAPFNANDLLDGVMGDEHNPQAISFAVYDGNATSQDHPLYRSDAANPFSAQARYETVKRMSVAGRPWTIAYHSGPSFEDLSYRSLTAVALAFGVLVSILLFVVTFSQARSQRRAERVADELLESDQALRASESRFRRLVDSNLIGVSFSTIDGKLLDGNEEYFRIIRRSRQDALAGRLRWDEVTPTDQAQADQKAVAQLKEFGVTTPFEKEYRREDGTRVPVLMGVALLAGSKTHTVAMVLDMTERKRAELQIIHAKEAADAARIQAEEASRLKDDFLATVSHELRTPLNAILGWAQLLRTARQDPEELEHGLQTIERSAKAQAELIEDLLDVSRIVAGKLRMNVQPVSLATVIESAIISVRPAADARGVRLLETLEDRACCVSGDTHRLQQIVWNLLSNAAKFTQKGGCVHIRLQRRGNDAAIIVADTGIGISPEFLPHIFERFRQADASTTRKYGGLGLGLAIVRHLVELHGGTVHAESPGQGKGATFTVLLPCSTMDASASGKPLVGSDAHLKGVGVLLVDDDPDARELIAHLLSGRGAAVATTSSAAEAVVQFNRQRPDVLISDIGMPDEDGYALLARIRTMPSDRGDVPAIALTALARPDDRQKALAAGFQLHLAKPVDAEQLCAAVSQLAGAPHESAQ